MEKLWVNQYPQGVPADIDLNRITSVADFLLEACQEFASKTAYISMGKSITYQQLNDQSRIFAQHLQSIGVRKGDRVALMMPNVLQYPITLFGTLRAGAVVVNCNPLYTPRELEHQLADSGATVIVILENFAHTLEQVIGKTQVRHVIVTPLGEMLGAKGHIVNFVVRKIKKLVPAWNLPQAISLNQALASGNGKPFTKPQLTPDDVAFLQYTGGTTGISKGAILTHRNICANVLQAEAWIKPVVRRGEEFIITALPLYHIFALTANCLTFLRIGAQNLLIANPRDIPNFVKEWAKYPVTVFTAVNTLFNALLNNPDFLKLNFSTMRVTLGGGMAVQRPVAERWRSVTGCALSQAYGLTETSPAATINPLIDIPFSGSIGLPISSTEVSIRDDQGTALPLGEVGEICIRGPQVTPGYWGRPDETAKIFFPDGFLKTGDMGYIDPQGYVFLVDRKKDMILVSGFNVYPNEVEEVVAMHPAVREVAAIGVADEQTGEAVKLFVAASDPSLTKEAIIEHCKEYLTNYKVPKQIEFRPELPKTNVGKILRRALRDG
ncbi:MAG: long-chain-fatty-acid--CoA ligase [Burkholderiaceae bacterium]|nr:long-chain-fatty-acid--CoA ligase [Burkholderiaceae bacterium]